MSRVRVNLLLPGTFYILLAIKKSFEKIEMILLFERSRCAGLKKLKYIQSNFSFESDDI